MSNVLFDKEVCDLAVELTGAEIDVLYALKKRGEVEIGDVPSKMGLRSLLSKGVATQLTGDKDQYFELSPTGHRLFDLLRKPSTEGALALVMNHKQS